MGGNASDSVLEVTEKLETMCAFASLLELILFSKKRTAVAITDDEGENHDAEQQRLLEKVAAAGFHIPVSLHTQSYTVSVSSAMCVLVVNIRKGVEVVKPILCRLVSIWTILICSGW